MVAAQKAAGILQMSLPEKDHPIWNAVTLAIAGLIAVVVLALRMKFAYNNGFDFEKDTATIFVQVATFVGAIVFSAGVRKMVNGSH